MIESSLIGGMCSLFNIVLQTRLWRTLSGKCFTISLCTHASVSFRGSPISGIRFFIWWCQIPRSQTSGTVAAVCGRSGVAVPSSALSAAPLCSLDRGKHRIMLQCQFLLGISLKSFHMCKSHILNSYIHKLALMSFHIFFWVDLFIFIFNWIIDLSYKLEKSAPFLRYGIFFSPHCYLILDLV